MDYISKVRRDKRRYLGFPKAETKYQKRKESTIMDFLFYMKKNRRIKKLNEFKFYHIEDYLNYIKENKGLKEGTILEKRKLLKSFYKRNKLDWEYQKQG